MALICTALAMAKGIKIRLRDRMIIWCGSQKLIQLCISWSFSMQYRMFYNWIFLDVKGKITCLLQVGLQYTQRFYPAIGFAKLTSTWLTWIWFCKSIRSESSFFKSKCNSAVSIILRSLIQQYHWPPHEMRLFKFLKVLNHRVIPVLSITLKSLTQQC